MIQDYNTIYFELCLHTHNNIELVYHRHVRDRTGNMIELTINGFQASDCLRHMSFLHWTLTKSLILFCGMFEDIGIDQDALVADFKKLHALAPL